MDLPHDVLPLTQSPRRRSHWAAAACSCVLLLWGAILPLAARSEVFHMANGGVVRGEIVNKKDDPRENYVVKTSTGGQIVLPVTNVSKIDHQTPNEIRFDRMKLTSSDTVKGHWELAEFCRENHLHDLRKAELQQIIELEPDHADARHALGYNRVKGKWLTQEQGMTDDGRVKYHGKWVLPQEVAIAENERKVDLDQKDWTQKIKRYRTMFDKGRAEQGREQINEITAPAAAKGLSTFLDQETDRDLKFMWIEALARVSGMTAMNTLVSTSLDDQDEEIRIACLERLQAAKYKPAVRRYTEKLKSSDNSTVNLAAVGLGYMKDSSAVPALIDALVTKHKYTVRPGGQPGQVSSSFGGPTSGGGAPGFSFGQAQPIEVVQNHSNQDVLRTLVALAGVNFDFDVSAWKYWYANQKKPAKLDARRD